MRLKSVLGCFVIIAVLATACGKDKTETCKVGIINYAINLKEEISGFKQKMSQLGYIEGENIIYLYDDTVTETEKP